MSRALELAGQRFGRLVAISKSKLRNGRTGWLCECDCGGIKIVPASELVDGRTSSCGCLYKETRHLIGKRSKQYNEYRIDGNIVFVKLNGKDEMMCDLDDWERLKRIKWHREIHGYAAGRDIETCKVVKFHVEVMGRQDNLVVDHINRNKIDNRKCNLRLATTQVNNINRDLQRNNKSGKTGVYKRSDKWGACITINGKRKHLGFYKNIEDAIRAREEAEEKYYKPLLETN